MKTIDLGALVIVEQPFPAGWGRNMVLVRLPSGGLLVHSPVWNGEETRALVEAVGRPEILWAPNHFHHLSLPRFRTEWPQAIAAASRGAIPRLTKKGHAGLRPVDELAGNLPAGARFLAGPGVKSGEVFLSLPGDGGDTYSASGAPYLRRGPTWIVCDAFFNMTTPVSGATGWFLRVTKTTPGLSLGQTFRWLALSDEKAYRAWLLETLAAERPRRVVFSHGALLDEPDTTHRLRALAEARLRA